VQKISLLEIISTVVLLANVVVVVVDLSRVFHVIDSATLQPVHRCTPAPYGILAVPAVLPTLLCHSWQGTFISTLALLCHSWQGTFISTLALLRRPLQTSDLSCALGRRASSSLGEELISSLAELDT